MDSWLPNFSTRKKRSYFLGSYFNPPENPFEPGLDPVLIPWWRRTTWEMSYSQVLLLGQGVGNLPQNRIQFQWKSGRHDGYENPERAMNLEEEGRLEAFRTTKKKLCIGIAPIGARKMCLQLSPIIGYNTIALQWLEQPCLPWGKMEEKLKGSIERKDSIPPHRKWVPRLITPEVHFLSGRKFLLCQEEPCRAPKATQCLP